MFLVFYISNVQYEIQIMVMYLFLSEVVLFFHIIAIKHLVQLQPNVGKLNLWLL